MKKWYLWLVVILVAVVTVIVVSPVIQKRLRATQQSYVYLPMVRTYGVVDGVGMTYAHCDWLQSVGAKWYYTWGPNPTLCPGLEAVPMIWGVSQAGQPIGGNSPWVMWWNECSLASQCNASPETAAAAYNAHQYPGKWNVAPNEIDLFWASQFLTQVTVKPQALGIHIYVWEPVDAAIARTRIILTNAVDLAQRNSIGEIWVSEWAALQGYMGQADAEEYMRRVLTEVLPDFPMVTREAWFQLTYRGDEPWAFGLDSNTSLVGYYTGQLTSFGTIYRNADVAPWDRRADVDGNNHVDISDMVIVGSNFGKP